MDFTNRGQQFQPKTDNNNDNQQHSSNHSPNHKKGSSFPHKSKLLKIFQVGLLSCVAILLIGILLSIATYRSNGEDDFVDTSKYQAVFLNGGQVYFGKITSLNPNYLTLSNIYYLQVDQQVQPGEEGQQNNFTLAKLGCELHRPHDTMVINKDQIIFWENLKDDDGQNTVPGAIKQHIASTNGEQNCEEQQQPAAGSDSGATNSAPSNANNNTTETNDTPPATTNNENE